MIAHATLRADVNTGPGRPNLMPPPTLIHIPAVFPHFECPRAAAHKQRDGDAQPGRRRPVRAVKQWPGIMEPPTQHRHTCRTRCQASAFVQLNLILSHERAGRHKSDGDVQHTTDGAGAGRGLFLSLWPTTVSTGRRQRERSAYDWPGQRM